MNLYVSVGLSFLITTGQTEIKVRQATGMFNVQHQAAAIIKSKQSTIDTAEPWGQVCSFIVLMSDNLAIRQESSSLSNLVFSRS